MKNIEPRMLFGFCLLAVIFILAVIIAIGHVVEMTSFGLPFLLGGLTNMSGAWSNWAFKTESKEKDKSE